MHHWISHWWQVGRKAPPPRWGKIFWLQIYPFQAILSKFGFCGRKFQAILSNFAFCGPPSRMREIFWLWIYPFQAILSNFAFCGRKAPPSPRMRENFLTLDLSISGDFEQLMVFVVEKPSHSPAWGKTFWLWIYLIQVILSNFGFCGRKATTPQDEGKFFDFGSIHFRQFWATLLFVAEKPPTPTPRMREKFLTLDLSISGDSEQVWLLWQRSPPPPQDEGNFFDFGSIHFRWFWASLVFVAEKPPIRMRENFLTLDLSISGDFEQVWLLWQRSPPPSGWGNFFDFGSIHFRQFWGTLVFCGRKAPPLPDEGKNFDFGSIHFRQFWASLVFVTEKPPLPAAWGKMFWLWIYPFQAILSKFGFCGRKAPSPRMREIFWLWIYPFQVIFEQLCFLWQKAPLQDEGKFFDFGSIHFRQFWASLVFVAEKPPPPQDEGKFFWLWIYPFQVILSKLCFCGRKSPPPPPPGWGKIFWLWIYPFQAILSKFGFCGRKSPPPRMRENFLTLDLSISGDFEQVWFLRQDPSPRMRENFLTLDLSISGYLEQVWFLSQKSLPPPPQWGKSFWLWIYPFQVILRKFSFCGRKAPPSFLPFGEILGSCCSTWHNFTDWYFMHHWISHWWQVGRKAPPPQAWGKIFWLQIYPFQAILSKFGFCGRKALPTGWGKIFWLWIYPFQVILSKFGFCGRKALPSPRMRENFLTLDLSISGDSEQVYAFVAEKPSHLQDEGNFFDFGSIHFRRFWEQLWFLWQKSPPPSGWGKIFGLWIYPFQAILRNFGFLWQKSPPSQMREKILTLDLSISGNFEQVWFLWQKSPPPPPRSMRENFLTLDLSISGNFEQVWFLWQKSPLPQDEGNFLTLDLSISGDFEQLCFLWQKAPLQDEGKFFDFGSIHFRQFWASLVFVAEKPSPPGWGKIFWLWIYPFQVILSKLCFCGRKAPHPHPQDEGKFFDFWSIHFRQFWASLVFVAEKHPPPQDEGKFFDFGSIHFRLFRASLVFVAKKEPPSFLPFGEILGSCCSTWHNFTDWYFMHHWISHWWQVGRKAPPPPKMRENFLTSDLSISGNFEQVWFLWQKSPPAWGKFFDFGSIHFRWFWATLLLLAEKPPSRMRENFLTLDLSISGNFEQLWSLW